MPTVYVWYPNVDRYGHSSLRLNDGTYISWWPRSKSKKDGTPAMLGGEPGVCSTFEEDKDAESTRPNDPKEPDETIQIPSTALDENKIRRWWNNYSGNYNGVSNNCATIVYTALREGGGHFKMPAGIWLPKAVGQYAREIRDGGKGGKLKK
eukprot:GHVT01055169.1.p1 GENE.GHVT01055169.1~~GHVT01055169.1.p1  ORF type:complete len:151 (+),score=1.53 GHVT01055169.1:119-571(+)